VLISEIAKTSNCGGEKSISNTSLKDKPSSLREIYVEWD
jgi:hypothetical protein